MPPPDPFTTATAGSLQVPPDWMPVSQVRALVLEDPALLWLEYHGAQYGFQPDESLYSFLEFIAAKSRQFEAKWLQEIAPQAVRVCREASEVRDAEKVRQTLE
ncbi:MAG TPA: hypothetical protein VJ436_13185, partial [Anaerolineales bacterium]|nr:hypothetical protein [Anaerolineales bacterium]